MRTRIGLVVECRRPLTLSRLTGTAAWYSLEIVGSIDCGHSQSDNFPLQRRIARATPEGTIYPLIDW
jgi:hypothetical protein